MWSVFGAEIGSWSGSAVIYHHQRLDRVCLKGREGGIHPDPHSHTPGSHAPVIFLLLGALAVFQPQEHQHRPWQLHQTQQSSQGWGELQRVPAPRSTPGQAGQEH